MCDMRSEENKCLPLNYECTKILVFQITLLGLVFDS